MTDEEEGLERRVPELLAITNGLVDDLQGHYRDLQIIKDGRLQITVFRPTDFKFLQIVVGIQGIYLLEDPQMPILETKMIVTMEGEQKSHGPYPLEDPSLFKHIYRVVDKWAEKRPS